MVIGHTNGVAAIRGFFLVLENVWAFQQDKITEMNM